MRGEHAELVEHCPIVGGIIPAYAGSTCRLLFCSISALGSSPHTRGAPGRYLRPRRCSRDHPRIRGEHLVKDRGERPGAGIIPAYAGSPEGGILKTLPSGGSSPPTRGAPGAPPWSRRSPRNHPRIRGEHRGSTSPAANTYGIIPAYAGSTMTVPSYLTTPKGSSPHTRGAPEPFLGRFRAAWDHPRIRGEH